jgi:hypothetical protein
MGLARRSTASDILGVATHQVVLFVLKRDLLMLEPRFCASATCCRQRNRLAPTSSLNKPCLPPIQLNLTCKGKRPSQRREGKLG